MSSQPISHKRSQHALNGQNDVEGPPAKRQKTGENFSHELNDDVAAKLLLTIHQNGASSSSSQQSGSSRSLPAKSLSLTRPNSNSSSSAESQAEQTVLKCMTQCVNFLAQKKNSEAVEVMQSAIGMKGVPVRLMPGLLGMLGKALTKNNRRDDVLKAIVHLRTALSIQPLEPATHAQLLLFLSAALGRRGDPKDADEMIACTETGLKLLDISDEVRAKLYSNLGGAYTLRQKDGDLKKAVEALSAGLALNVRETRPLLFFHLGEVYSASKGMESREAAIKNYKEAMACENA
ncbi:MAG: tetratricopeptide repeat protein, partial [Chlamydiales bacterium]